MSVEGKLCRVESHCDPVLAERARDSGHHKDEGQGLLSSLYGGPWFWAATARGEDDGKCVMSEVQGPLCAEPRNLMEPTHKKCWKSDFIKKRFLELGSQTEAFQHKTLSPLILFLRKESWPQWTSSSQLLHFCFAKCLSGLYWCY